MNKYESDHPETKRERERQRQKEKETEVMPFGKKKMALTEFIGRI